MKLTKAAYLMFNFTNYFLHEVKQSENFLLNSVCFLFLQQVMMLHVFSFSLPVWCEI